MLLRAAAASTPAAVAALDQEHRGADDALEPRPDLHVLACPWEALAKRVGGGDEEALESWQQIGQGAAP
jgi:hypothetical protein